MARPQLENGYTSIAHELNEALCRINLSAYESRVIWFILRKTYGYHKKLDRISFSQFTEGTGIDRRHVGRVLNSLKRKNIIVCSGAGYLLEYGLQKDYEQWKIDTNLGNDFDTQTGNVLTPKEAMITDDNLTPIQGDLTPIQGGLTPKEAMILTPKEALTKERKIITKDNIQKKEYGEFKNVLLSDDEKQKLTERFSKEWTDNYIEQLSGYMQQSKANTKKYTDHYATLRNWLLRDGKNGGSHGKIGQHPQGNGTKVYTQSPDYGD